jgi:hypothetical protein
MTEEDWVLVLEVFHACRSRLHKITWRALPAEFGSWNSIWKRFWRLSRSGVFETFFEALASLSERAHLVQIRHPRACVGGRRKRGQDGEALGRSRGGFSTKIHLKTDLDGYPIGFHLTGGEASDSRNFEVLLDLGPDVPGLPACKNALEKMIVGTAGVARYNAPLCWASYFAAARYISATYSQLTR